jgi:hypothetical protein
VAAVDVAFDSEGNLVGSDTQALFKTAQSGDAQLWVPGVGGRGGVRYLPDGRLVYVQDALKQVLVVTPEGETSVLIADLVGPYGLAIDLEGLVYIADTERIVRVDPDTLESEDWLTGHGAGVRSISFNPEYDALYVGGLTSWIYRIELDAEGQATAPEMWGSIYVGKDEPPDSDGLTDIESTGGEEPQGGGGPLLDIGTPPEPPEPGEHLAGIDSMGVDACGNVYLTEYYTRSLYGISRNGGEGVQMVSWIDPSIDEEYAHGFAWGSGIGGWNETSIYLAQPYAINTVIEIDLGIESKPMPFP